jgi:hypothetical protein
LLHIACFPGGALLHDYWAYLLAPPAALVVGHAVRSWDGALVAGSRWRPLLAAGLLLCGGVYAADGATAVRARMVAEREQIHRFLGELVRDETPEDARILTSAGYNPWGGQRLVHPEFSFYARRKVRGDVRDRATFLEAQAELRPTHYLEIVLQPVEADLRDLLAERPHRSLGAGITLYELSD